MKKFFFGKLALASFALLSSIGSYAQEACSEWSIYLSDVTGNNSTIYKVNLNDNNATAELTALKSVTYPVHLAFNQAEGLLYLVNSANGAIQSLDPSTVDGALGEVLSLQQPIANAVAAVFSPSGDLLLGGQNENKIFQINTEDGSRSFYADAQVSGGDIAFDQEENLYLATRSNGRLKLVIPGFDNMVIGSVPNLVTGMALMEDGKLIVSANGNTSLITRNTDGSDAGINYALSLNGESFTLSNGDMASGCSAFTTPPSIEECNNFKTYYTGYPSQGGANELFEVAVADGTATFTLIPGFSTADNHIALDDEGLIYAVRSSFIDIFDPSTGTYLQQDIPIKTQSGASLNGFPTAVIDSEGTLWLARGANNTVYSVNFTSGEAIVTPQFSNVSVSGGDLVVTLDGDGADVLWLANRTNNQLYNLNEGTSIAMPVTQVNGISVLADGQLLLANGALNATGGLYVWNPSTGDLVQLAAAGGPNAYFNGDLAGRCIDADDDNQEPEPILCFGAEVLKFEQGFKTNGQPVAADRSIPALALGAPQLDNSAGSFVSLGVDGYIEIGFEGVVFDLPGNDILVVETSFSGNNCGGNDDEFADIALSMDGITYIEYGTICRNEEIDIASTGLPYVVAIRITNSEDTNTPDGYDVDGVVALQGCEDFSVIVPEFGDCVATKVLEYNPGGNIPASRMIPEKALNTPERDDSINFVSLGFGGSLVLGFDGAALALPGVNDLEVVETTFGNQNCQSFEERAAIYVSQQVVADTSEIDHDLFVYVGESCTNGAFFDVHEATGLGYFTLVKIVDVTPLSAQFSNRDGFDVDGIVALNNECFGNNEPEIIDPFCTNSTVIQQHNVTDGNVRLTAMGNYQECSGEYGYRWRIRNESGEPRIVFYNFAGAPEMQGPFNLEGNEEVHFTTAFGAQVNGGGTMRIFVDQVQVDVKAHGGGTKNLAECGVACPDTPPTSQGAPAPSIEFTAYPNPSSGPVTVTFSNEREEMVSIEVMDMSGRVVESIFRQVSTPGQMYRIDFEGSRLPNGVYLTRLTTPSDVLINKIMMAK